MSTARLCVPIVLSLVVTLGTWAKADARSAVALRHQTITGTPTRGKPAAAGFQANSDEGLAADRASSPQQQQNQQPNIVVQMEQPLDRTDNTETGGWLRYLLGLVLPWPALVFAALLYVVFSSGAPSRIEELLTPFHSLKLFGQEFVLNSQGGKKAEVAIGLYRKEVQKKLDRQVKKLKLQTKHENLIKNYASTKIPDFAAGQVRSTIYVPDLLFAETLYQLLDYYPAQTEPGRGRAFSARFGIIGKAWRLTKSQHASTVPTAEEQLVLEWGMTREEARKAGQGRQSFGCVILKGTTGSPLAVFYLDSPTTNAFGDENTWETLETAILEGARQTQLIDALESINKNLLSVSPRVHIYSSSHMASS